MPDLVRKAIIPLVKDPQFWIPLAVLIAGVLVLRWVS
jgi:hypothetical protein